MVLFVPIFSMGTVTYAQGTSQTIAVSAVVAPHVYLVVNDSGQITQIFNNSHRESEPSVLVGSLSGPVGQFSPAIISQYANLKPSLDFSKYGILYQKPSFMKRVLSSALVQSKIF